MKSSNRFLLFSLVLMLTAACLSSCPPTDDDETPDPDPPPPPPSPLTSIILMEEGAGEGPLLANREGRMVFSPDGLFAYVPNWGSENSFEVYHRDPKTGSLSFAQAVKLYGINGEYWYSIESIRTTPDGKFVIPNLLRQDGFAVLRRDPHSGLLTQTTSLPIDIDVRGVYGNQVYGRISDMVVGTIDHRTGHLTSFAMALDRSEYEIPDSLLFSNDGRHAYGEFLTYHDENTTVRRHLVVLQRDPLNGRLTPLQTASTIGDSNGDIFLSPDQRFLYSTTKRRGLFLHARDTKTGLLTRIGSLLDRMQNGDGIVATPELDALFTSQVYTGVGTDNLHVYQREPSAGQLKLSIKIPEFPGGPLGLLTPLGMDGVSPDGSHVYMTTSKSRDWAIFRHLPHHNILRFDGTTNIAGFPIHGLNGIIDSAITADGSSLFVLSGSEKYGDNTRGKIAEFVRDPDSADLKLRFPFEDDPDGFPSVPVPVSVESTSTGSHLIVLGSRTEQDGDIRRAHLFARDPDSGEMRETYNKLFNHEIDDAIFSPDDRHVYFINGIQIIVAELDKANDSLRNFRNTPFDPSPFHIVTPMVVQFSADGTRLYLTNTPIVPGQLFVTLTRNPNTGLLTQTHFVREDVGTGRIPRPMALSHDGKNLYSYLDIDRGATVPKIWIGDLDAVDGSVQSLRFWERPTPDAPGPEYPIDAMKMAPNDRQLLILETIQIGNSTTRTRVYIFNRDPANGDLAFGDMFETFELDEPEEYRYGDRFVFEVLPSPWGGTLVYVGTGKTLTAFRIEDPS